MTEDPALLRVAVAILLKKSGGQIKISHKEAAAIMDSKLVIDTSADGVTIQVED